VPTNPTDGQVPPTRQDVRVSELDVIALSGRFVILEPMSADHVEEIAAAGRGDRSSFGFTQVPDGDDEAADYVAWLLDDAAHGRAAPFVQRRVADGAVVGCTRFLNPLWPLGRAEPDEVEIGGTWLSASAQRTPINTEAKLLLLSHAFGWWNAQRVAICTDARNEQSRRAIERLGATFEGVMRRHRRSTRSGEVDTLRDTATYSIIIDEWPSIEARLRTFIDT
jgi:N-acetyltransferase